MNKYIHAAYCVPCGIVKMVWTKLFHMKEFRGPKLSMVSPLTEITLDNGGRLEIGENFKMRDGAKIRVRTGGVCQIGRNTSLNCNNIITCREKVIIGNDVYLSPNVQIYDHDHDFRTEGGVKAGKYRTESIEIGSNVWIGANSVILKGSRIGDNAVIAAGSIVKGEVPSGTVLIQKRINEIR